jgi:two-component sensor histidine kinase
MAGCRAVDSSQPVPVDRGFRSPRGTLLAASGLIVVFFLLFVGITIFLFLQGYRDAYERAEDKAASASQLVATNAGWIYETAQQALRRIDEALGADLSGIAGNVVQDISQSVEALPGSVKVYVVDEKGDTRFSTDPQVQAINITDREYFTAHVAGEVTHVSGLLVSRLNNEQIFTISRRLERNGVFEGVAVISIEVKLLGDFWRSLELGSDSTISLVRTDGELVARYPLAPGPQNTAGVPLFEHLKEAPAGTYAAVSQIDGVKRIAGYRTVEGTTLIAAATVSEAESLEGFWRSTATTLLLAVPSAAGLAIVSIWIALLLHRDAKRREDLTKALDTNRLLFREIHHRVKNNLQSIQSLVTLQNIPAEAKFDMRSRIAAMAAVHEHLYRSDHYDQVEAAQYIPAIVDPLVHTYGADRKVEYRIESLTIDHDQATPVGLLVNELVSNALKYAFGGRDDGIITIALERSEIGWARLTVADDGVGFDPEAVVSGMGSRLIAGIAAQLQGSSRYERGEGTGSRFVLDFPLGKPTRSAPSGRWWAPSSPRVRRAFRRPALRQGRGWQCRRRRAQQGPERPSGAGSGPPR